MLKRALFVVAMPLAATVLIAPVWGQTVFRCGSSYSLTPCPGAVAIDANDSRTPEQKAQTDAAAAQAGKIADRMERDRMERDRIAREQALAGRSSGTSAQAAKEPKAATSKTRKSSHGKTTKPKPKRSDAHVGPGSFSNLT